VPAAPPAERDLTRTLYEALDLLLTAPRDPALGLYRLGPFEWRWRSLSDWQRQAVHVTRLLAATLAADAAG
jgi:hypothetical protein